MRNGLFRQQAIAFQTQQLPGQILLVPKLSYGVSALMLFIWLLSAIIFLNSKSYHRSASVRGWLTSQAGVVKIQALESGVVETVSQKLEDTVEEGQRVITITNAKYSEQGQLNSELQANTLHQQKQRLATDLAHTRQLHRRSNDTRKQAKHLLQQELAEVLKIERYSKQQVDLLQVQLIKIAKLVDSGNLPAQQTEELKAKILRQKTALAQTSRERVKLTYALNDIEHALAQMPDRQAKEIIALVNKRDELEQRIRQLKGLSHQHIVAPVTGQISHIAIKRGQFVRPGQLLLSILQDSDVFEASLFVPVQSAGFIQEGQTVQLKYDAYPYQKFGHVNGKVTHVSNSVMLPNEQLNTPIPINEAGYIVKVNVPSDAITAYGKPVKLKPGMTFSADVQLSHRTLFEWLVEPILSLKGNLS